MMSFMYRVLTVGCVGFGCLVIDMRAADASIVLSAIGVASTENYNSYRGAGFAPTPTSGQLDSDAYRAVGFSDLDGLFGGTHTTGDFARGTSVGGVSTGGAYGFEVGGAGSGDFALGVQPTGADFTPGQLTIRFSNQTGQAISTFQYSATGYFFNDEGRSTEWTFEASLDDTLYAPLTILTSPEAADAAPVWAATPINGTFTIPLGGSVANGAEFFVRVSGRDLGGAGGRDEFALDNLSLTAVPEPSSIFLLGAVFVSLCRRRSR